MHETGFQRGNSRASDWKAARTSPIWLPDTGESCERKKPLISKCLEGPYPNHHFEDNSVLQVLKEEVLWGPALALGGAHQSRDLFSPIGWAALSNFLGPATFLPALQGKKTPQLCPRGEVLHKHQMRNSLGRTVSVQCMREKSQQTGAGEAGLCGVSDTGELCVPSHMRPTPGTTQGTWEVQEWRRDSMGSMKIGQKGESEPEITHVRPWEWLLRWNRRPWWTWGETSRTEVETTPFGLTPSWLKR